MVAVAAVYGAGPGVDHQACFHRCFFKMGVQYELGRKRGFAGLILNEFNADEKAASTYVTYIRVLMVFRP